MAELDPFALTEQAERQLDTLDAHATLYAKHLASGAEVAVRADDPVDTLSVIKLPILALAYRDIEAGVLDLDERCLVSPQDMRNGTGWLKRFDPGLQPTLRDVLKQMIISSDNTATDMVLSRVGLERVNALLTELGYKETRMQSTLAGYFHRRWVLADPANASMTDHDVFVQGFPSDENAAERSFAFEGVPAQWLGRSTAREMGRFVEQIQTAQLTTRERSDEMIDLLCQQQSTSRLPSIIGDRTVIGHKTGDMGPIAGNDVGIIYAGSGPIVVSLFVNQNRGDFDEVEATHGRVAEMLFDAWG